VTLFRPSIDWDSNRTQMMRGIVVNNLRLSSGVIVFKKPKPSLLLSLRTIQRNMSSESISKLPDLARSLVENILGQNQASGLTEGDKVLVDEWVGKASSGSWSESSLKVRYSACIQELAMD